MELTVLETILAVLIAVFGTGRVTRIITHDDYPPTEWFRGFFSRHVSDSWAPLVTCIWCAQPYVAAGCIAWGYFSDMHWSWWVFWGWMALSQAGSQNLAYDEPAE